MKKILAILLTAMLALLPFGGVAEEAQYEELTVGTVNELTGSFFTDMWGSNTSDVDVRLLLHGYNPVRWDAEHAIFVADESVVSGISASKEDNGDRTYTLVLNDSLVYSDGTPITAKDYAFSILLSMAPQMAALGADTTETAYIAGSDAYAAGETDVLTGVRVISDDMLRVTVKAEYFPYFYELSYFSFNPYPISVIAPGCEVADDGNGVYIRNADGSDEPIFTEELLRETVLGENGYRSHPSVTSGPYVLTSYDEETHTATFERNTYYTGNTEGVVPTIEKLTFTSVTNANMMEKLESGEIGLINKVVNAGSVQSGLEFAAEGDFTVNNYARSGLGMLSFCCERPAMSSEAVRRAVSLCLDKDTLISDYVGSYGIAVNGYYGMGQWIYLLVNGTITAAQEPAEDATEEEKTAYQAWQDLSMDGVTDTGFDVDAARELLADDGWTMNENGGEFDADTDEVRCKEIGGELVPLRLKLITAAPATVPVLQELLADNLKQIGVVLSIETVDASDIFANYYREQERDCDIILIATNFSAVFDPSKTYDPADAETGAANYSGLADEELYQAALDLRETDPGDVLTYCQKWVTFQELWTEKLPAIPLYSNVYFDFSTNTLHDYDIANSSSWATAIMNAYLGDATVTEDEENTENAEEETDVSGDGEMVIED